MQNEIVAKPVVQDQFWLLHANDRKIGNVTAIGDTFAVRIADDITEYPSLSMVEREVGIKFVQQKKTSEITTIRGYDTDGPAFNQTWDVVEGLPLFTRTESGQCWHVAGWFVIQRGDDTHIENCPKLIYVRRYPSRGPFLTKREAENDIGIQ